MSQAHRLPSPIINSENKPFWDAAQNAQYENGHSCD